MLNIIRLCYEFGLSGQNVVSYTHIYIFFCIINIIVVDGLWSSTYRLCVVLKVKMLNNIELLVGNQPLSAKCYLQVMFSEVEYLARCLL